MKAACNYTVYKRESIVAFVVFLSLIMIWPSAGWPANFSINPIRVFFGAGKKTDIIRIKNESQKIIALQISAVDWTMDEKGENIYTPSEDILFFPKLVEINPDEEKILRVGIKVTPADTEKTYRLFIEEMPDDSKPDTTSVKILMKIGVPLFVPPVKTAASGVIENIELRNGSLRVGIKNEGNTHFLIQSMKAAGRDGTGKEAYSTEKAGGYLHHGKAREFIFEIPKDVCPSLKTLNVHIDTDRLTMEKEIEITGKMCGP